MVYAIIPASIPWGFGGVGMCHVKWPLPPFRRRRTGVLSKHHGCGWGLTGGRLTIGKARRRAAWRNRKCSFSHGACWIIQWCETVTGKKNIQFYLFIGKNRLLTKRSINNKWSIIKHEYWITRQWFFSKVLGCLNNGRAWTTLKNADHF